ncbi:MAG: DNA polymerase IV [Methylocystaceae bacterium]
MNDNRLHIIHCDLDAFFAAVEQRDHPELIGKPVIVGGNPESRSVVSTCSYEARTFGVHSAMPTSQARILCPQGIFLPVDMPRYVQASHEVFAIFHEFTPLVEGLSIDEAFLDINGCERLFGDAVAIGQQIKARVKKDVGLNISVGISVNKFLAKLATELGKPDGLKVIHADEIDTVLSPLPVSYLWGAGKRTVEYLNRLGIETIGQLREFGPVELGKRLGKSGQDLWMLAQGIDERVVEPEREAKSMGKETTFDQDISSREVLQRTLLEFAGDVGRRLRKDQMEAKTVNLKLRYSDFKTVTRAQTLPAATNSDLLVYQVAVNLLDQLSLKKQVRLIGLSASGLQPAGNAEEDTSLFAEESKDSPIDAVVDKIRDRYGKSAITRAALLDDSTEPGL